MNKKIPVWLALLFLWFGFIITIFFGWAVWHIDQNNSIINEKTSEVIISVARLPALIKQSIQEIGISKPLVAPAIYPNLNGFKAEKKYIDSNYILMSSYDSNRDQSVTKLIRLSDQKTIHRWQLDYDELSKLNAPQFSFLKTASKLNLRIIHPLLAKDGSIVFNCMYSPLVKINKASKLIWVINGSFHHSNEFDAAGNIWTPVDLENSTTLACFLTQYSDDAIAQISPGGKVLFRKSIIRILMENGYRGLLLGSGKIEKDLLHVNDIQPALTASHYWAKDDLLISLRHRSCVFLYRPSTNKILWLKTGPWINQHDVDFIDSTRISFFGNNMIRTGYGEKLIDGHNEQYVYDFKTDKVETPYSAFMKKAKIGTLSEGRSDILPNGDLFIEETNNNRLLRGNKKDILWQYVDQIDKNHVAALSWSRFITKEEFKKLTFLKKN